MLFMITQVHTPESCPKDEGSANSLINAKAKGIAVKGRWGAWPHHTIWYLVDAESLEAVQSLLEPGMKRCTCTVEAVEASPVSKK
jgi:hypothetical protein